MAKQKKQAKGSRVTRILNCVPSRNMENDWGLEHADGASVVSLKELQAIPPSKDLREAWWTISDQGATGACVGWASADSVIRWHLVKANRMRRDQRLSVREVWMGSKETDEFTTYPTTYIEGAGTSLKAALDLARKYGIVLEGVLPFKPVVLYGGDERTFYVLAAAHKIASYFNLKPPPLVSQILAWRLWLATKGPILTRLGVDATWDHATQTQGKLDVYQPNTIRGGHAVALVGYTPDRFIVRNSWGTGWGDKGYAYASIAYATQAFTESYGVIV